MKSGITEEEEEKEQQILNYYFILLKPNFKKIHLGYICIYHTTNLCESEVRCKIQFEPSQ